MKKIGIITFQESNNYGALLQAYALQSTIEKLGNVVEIIDYHSEKKEEQYSSSFSKNRSLLVNLNLFFSRSIRKKMVFILNNLEISI